MKITILLLTLLFSFVGQAQLKKSTESYVSQNGKNFLKNPGFEQYTRGWSNTGGTKAVLTGSGDVGEGNRAARFTATAGAQYFESELASLSNIGKAQAGCMADFYYKGGAGFDVKIYEGANLIATQSIVVAAADWAKFPTLAVPCNPTMKIRFESTAAGTIDVDNVYLGSNKGVGPVSIETDWADAGASVLTGAGSNPTKGTIDTDKVWWKRVGSDMHIRYEYRHTTAGGTGTGYYLLEVPGGYEIDSSKVTLYPVGTGTTTANYMVNAVGHGNITTSVGSNDGAASLYAHDSTHLAINVTFSAGDGNWGSGFAPMDSTQLSYSFYAIVPIEGWGTSTVQAFTPDAAEFFISANIGGANSTQGVTSTPVSPSDPSWDMVLDKGTAKVPCTGTNPPTGLTCGAGNPMMGINFDAPVSGKYRSCFTYTAYAASGGTHSFRIAETPNNAQTILQQGAGGNHHAGTNASIPHTICDTFSLSAGNKTLRMFATNSTALQIIAARNPTDYYPDIHITVELVGHNVSRPILTGDTVTTPGSNRPVIYGCQVDGTTGVTAPIIPNTGCESWVQSTAEGSGVYTITFKSSAFDQLWSCQVTCSRDVAGGKCNAQFNDTDITVDLTTSKAEFVLLDQNGTQIVHDFAIMCIGTKP